MKYMPRTRRLLGERGVTFRTMLSPHPLCCPARAEILTGQYAHNNGVRSNNPSRTAAGPTSIHRHTIATWLHDAGYRHGVRRQVPERLHEVARRAEPGWDIWNPLIKHVYNYFGYTTLRERRTRGSTTTSTAPT